MSRLNMLAALATVAFTNTDVPRDATQMDWSPRRRSGRFRVGSKATLNDGAVKAKRRRASKLAKASRRRNR